MRTLKNIFIILIFIVMVSCKKDNEKGSANNYSYQGKNYNISGGELLLVDGDVYLFFKGGITDYVQVIFADKGQEIPIGTYTYHGNRYNGYNPGLNFWSGSVTYDSGMNDQITGGTFNISKSGDNYQVSFDLTTDKGAIKGNYTGKFIER